MNLENMRTALLAAPSTMSNVARLSRRLRPAVRNPWTLAWQLLRSRTCICTAILPNGDRFLLRNTEGDMFVLMEVFGRSAYGSLFKEFEGGVGQIVDIGANIGAFTIAMARRADAILAVEPEPTNVNMLKFNIQSNFLGSRVIIEQAAVGHTDAEGRLRLGLNSLLHSVSTDIDKPAIGNFVEVNILSLSSLCKKHQIQFIDLLKIDCEGSEYSIIYGSNRDIFDRVRSIIVELHRCPGHNDEPDRMIKYMKFLGFRVIYTPEEVEPGEGFGIGLLTATR